MFGLNIQNSFVVDEEYHTLDDYQKSEPRWCPGCGNSAIMSSLQRLCSDEQLPPETTVFVSGIGCSGRFPHYMNAYGFHGLHGRALPIAEGIKIRRPDLNVFVNMGDGDCCSIGTSHWIHAIRYNMNMVAILHDNSIYGMTKKQASPTTPKGLKTNTTPFGADLEPLNPTCTTLGVKNVSFVAQAVDWIPDILHDIIQQAFHHRGFSFVRVIQRCPHYLPSNPLLDNPDGLLLLSHEQGLHVSDEIARIYTNHERHDPSDLNRARELASMEDKTAIGILYRNENVPCYEELRKPQRTIPVELKEVALENEQNKYCIG